MGLFVRVVWPSYLGFNLEMDSCVVFLAIKVRKVFRQLYLNVADRIPPRIFALESHTFAEFRNIVFVAGWRLGNVFCSEDHIFIHLKI